MKGRPTIGNYEQIAKIGSGAFGSIIKVRSKDDGKFYAVKMALKKSQRDTEKFKYEADILKELDYPTIVKYVDFIETETRMYIIMELCEGDLETELNLKYKTGKKNIILKPESEVLKYIRQIALGIQHIHDHGIIHRDIKLANILLCDGIIKITDFGLSIKYDPNAISYTVGTPLYMSPEEIKQQQYSYPVDIWSLGIIAYTVLHGHVPFDVDNHKMPYRAKLEELNNKILTSEPIIRSDLTENTKDLLQRMLDKNPTTRITINDVINHPAFSEGTFYYVKLPEADISVSTDDIFDANVGFVEGKDIVTFNVIGSKLPTGTILYVGMKLANTYDLDASQSKVFENIEDVNDYLADNPGIMFGVKLP